MCTAYTKNPKNKYANKLKQRFETDSELIDQTGEFEKEKRPALFSQNFP